MTKDKPCTYEIVQQDDLLNVVALEGGMLISSTDGMTWSALDPNISAVKDSGFLLIECKLENDCKGKHNSYGYDVSHSIEVPTIEGHVSVDFSISTWAGNEEKAKKCLQDIQDEFVTKGIKVILKSV